MVDWERLAEDVRVARARRRVDQTTAAEQMGIGGPSLSRFENGKTLTVDGFMAVCKWLGITAESTLK